MAKKTLRQTFRQRRDAVSAALGRNWGPAERDRFFSFLGGRRDAFPGRVLSYFAIGSEPSILPPHPSDTWLFPTVVGRNLEWFEWNQTLPLPPAGAHGRRELAATQPWSSFHTGSCGICFVPQLAVDLGGQRLGYGGGYYDRFLAEPGVLDRLLLVACSHEDLLAPSLPAETHDVPVDVIVTGQRVLVVSQRPQMLSRLGSDKVEMSGD